MPHATAARGLAATGAAATASTTALRNASLVGEGANRWPAVHVADAARLVRLAVEGAPPGSVLHAAAENVPFRSIAESIGRQLEVPAAGVAAEAAGAHFGPLGAFAGLDMPVTSARTQELVGWRPTGPTLLDDLDAGRYTR
ncbi:MAG TPA: hypothetical protein VFP61_05545 [Acidimicrobiales bacterium]|nr:hypothetical protein [Acidimicrobiales bacterium]